MSVAESSHPADASAMQPWLARLAWLFSYDVLHVRQKLRPFTEKYQIADELDRPRFHVVRPPRLALNLPLSLGVGIVRFMLLMMFYRHAMAGGVSLASIDVSPAVLALFVLANFLLSIAHALLAPYRDIEVFADEQESWRILSITQDNKLALWREYTLHDCLGGEVARFRRSTLASFIRREWRVETPDGTPLYRVREDSLVRALLRRYLGTMYGLLRTNFNFEFEDGTVFGQYDRKLTILDQYFLDLRADPERRVDRRTTLAMAILLDTAESR